MKKRDIGVKRILRIMIIVCVFAVFAGGQVFAADGWPDGVQDNGIPALVLSIDEQEFENVINSFDHSYSAEGVSFSSSRTERAKWQGCPMT